MNQSNIFIGRGGNPVKKLIEQLVDLRKAVQDNLNEEQEVIGRVGWVSQRPGLADPGERLATLRQYRKDLEKQIEQKCRLLGGDGEQEYRVLLTNKFLQLRLNARIIKLNIRQRLRDRKFERERLERCYRNVMNGMSSLLRFCFSDIH